MRERLAWALTHVGVQYVHGLRAKNASHCLLALPHGCLVFCAGALAVVHDVASNTQSFFRGHDAPLTALARRHGGDEIASGQTKGGAGQSPMLCIWRYTHASRRCTLLSGE